MFARPGRIDRSEVARDLIRRLDARYQEGIAIGPGALAACWHGRLEGVGEAVRVETPMGPVVGRLVRADWRDGLTLGPIDRADEPPRRVACAEVLSILPEA